MENTDRNQMKGKERYQLMRWLDEKKETVGRMRLTDCADIATKDLGFRITANNISGAARDLEISVGARNGTRGNTDRSRDNFRTTARWVADIYKLLGEPVPSDISQVAGR